MILSQLQLASKRRSKFAKGIAPSYRVSRCNVQKRDGSRTFHSGKWHIQPGFPKSVGECLFNRSYCILDFEWYHSPKKAKLGDIFFVLDSSNRSGKRATRSIAKRSGAIQKHLAYV